MGLELRKGRDGSYIDHWFGGYKDANGKRHSVALDTKTAGTKPASLRDKGDELFEASRAAALVELKNYIVEAKPGGRTEHLTEKLIKIKTGREWKDTLIADLPSIAQTMKGSKACRNDAWRAWRVAVIQSFAAWAEECELRSVLDVTPDVAERYIEKVAKPDDNGRRKTDSTMRRIKAILGSVFERALPAGIGNPFKGIGIYATEDGHEVHRKPLTPEEVDKLLRMAETDSFAYPLIVTALSTALRRGDVCRLKWSSIDRHARTITVKTSKTSETVTIPILDRLWRVLENALSERNEKEVFVFPEAEKMLRENPDGVTWRVKKVFARAFALPQEAVPADTDAPARVKLADVLPDVLKAVEGVKMTAGARAKMVDLLKRYAGGQSYRVIQADWKISRGAISGLLHKAEKLANVSFMPDHKGKTGGIKEGVDDITRNPTSSRIRSASKYDFHSLRTSFVTLALFGDRPMTLDQVKAITGHKTVELILKHYAKPGAQQMKKSLEGALPLALTGGGAEPRQITQGDPIAELAAQFRKLTKADKMRLSAMLKK